MEALTEIGEKGIIGQMWRPYEGETCRPRFETIKAFSIKGLIISLPQKTVEQNTNQYASAKILAGLLINMKYYFDLWESENKNKNINISFESSILNVDMIPVLLTSGGKKDAVWEIGVGGSIDTKPLFYKNVVYFGACDKNFYAVNAETGKELWRFSTEGPIFASDAVIHNNVLYFGSLDHNLYALEAETGELVWKFKASDAIFSIPQMFEDSLFFASRDGNVYRISFDGKLLWKKSFPFIIWLIKIHENRLFIGTHETHALYHMDLNGNLIWKFVTQGPLFPQPTIHDGIVYISSIDNNVYAVDLKTGKQLWRFTTGDGVDSGATIYKNLVLFGSRDKNFYALDRLTGKEVWRFQTNNMIGWRSVVKNGRVYFGSWDHNLYVLDVNTGKLIWKFQTNGPVDNIPEIANDKVFFGSYDCNLYALNLNGELLWKFPTSIQTPAPIELVSVEEETPTIQTLWKLEEQEKQKENKQEVQLSDYGQFETNYASGLSKDYVKGKKGYM